MDTPQHDLPLDPDGDLGGDLDLTDPATMECPYGLYRALHDGDVRTLAVAGVGHWVGRMADVRDVATDTARFSNQYFGDDIRPTGVSGLPVEDDVAAIFDAGPPVRKALWMTDPPVHSLHRALVNRAFTPRRVAALEPVIRQIAHDAIDRFAERGAVEFMSEYAIVIPMTVIADALGVSRDMLYTFKRWCDDILAGNLDLLDHQRRRQVATSFVEYCEYFADIVADRRTTPRDDMISAIANAEVDGQRMDLAEVLAATETLLLAGNETTKNLIGNAMLMLLQHPSQLAEVRADPGLVPNMLEEVLRYEGPVQCLYRLVTGDTEIAGTPISAGSMVMLGWGSAGRDPRMFDDPDRFDIHRANAREHVNFGFGPHFCIGAPLARAEGRIAFEVLFERLGPISLAPQASTAHVPTFATRGLQRLDLEFERS